MIVIKTRQPDPELEGKILAFLEREHIDAGQISISSRDKLTFPGLTIDVTTREVLYGSRKLPLTRLEFDLLLVLASHEGNACSKSELFSAVWGRGSEDTLKVVANTISNLRRKIGDSSGQGYIRTVQGGYAFSVSPEGS